MGMAVPRHGGMPKEMRAQSWPHSLCLALLQWGGGPEESPRPFRWLDLKSLEAKCAVCSMIPP